jgi:hypothetical protein
MPRYPHACQLWMSTLTTDGAERKSFVRAIEMFSMAEREKMKNWGLRILSALLTFTVGTGAAIIGWRYLKPDVLQSVRVAPNINLYLPQLPPPQIAEDTQLTVKADEVMKPHPVSISPYEIKFLIDQNNKADEQQQGNGLDFGPIWARLGIKQEASKKKFLVDDVCNGNCEALLSILELDGKPGKEVLLRLFRQVTDEYIYLIFKRANPQSNKARWILLGYIPVCIWYEDSHQRVETIGTNKWLVITHNAGHGSAYGREDDDWYEVSDNGVTLAFSYYVHEYDGMNPATESKTKIVKSTLRNGVPTITLQVSYLYLDYDESGDRLPLWREKAKATFAKKRKSSKFVPDFSKSEMSAEGICDLTASDDSCQSESSGNTTFLQYNYEELSGIAARGNEKQKEWLRNFLKDCDESVEKQSLQKALEGVRP